MVTKESFLKWDCLKYMSKKRQIDLFTNLRDCSYHEYGASDPQTQAIQGALEHVRGD